SLLKTSGVLAVTTPVRVPSVHAKASETSSTKRSCSEGDLLLFDDDDKETDFITFELPSAQSSVRIKEELELTPASNLSSGGESYTRLETREEQQKSGTSPLAQNPSITREDGFGHYTSVRPLQFVLPSKRTSLTPDQLPPIDDNSGCLIDLAISREAAPTAPIQQLS